MNIETSFIDPYSSFSCFSLAGGDTSISAGGENFSPAKDSEQEEDPFFSPNFMKSGCAGPVCFSPHKFFADALTAESPSSHPAWLSPIPPQKEQQPVGDLKGERLSALHPEPSAEGMGSMKMAKAQEVQDQDLDAAELEDFQLTQYPTGQAIAFSIEQVQGSNAAELFFETPLKSACADLDCTDLFTPGLSAKAAPETLDIAPSKQDFDYEAILTSFIDKVKQSKGNYKAYLPYRYFYKFVTLKETTDPSFGIWQDAMLHNPPCAMLQSLNRLQTICEIYTKSNKQAPMPRYLFPCSFLLSTDFERKNWNLDIDGKATFIRNKKYVVLELTLDHTRKPYHLFLRILKEDKEYLTMHLGKNKNKVIKMLEKNIKKFEDDNMRPLTTNGSAETEDYMAFYVSEGVSIVAIKKKTK